MKPITALILSALLAVSARAEISFVQSPKPQECRQMLEDVLDMFHYADRCLEARVQETPEQEKHFREQYMTAWLAMGMFNDRDYQETVMHCDRYLSREQTRPVLQRKRAEFEQPQWCTDQSGRVEKLLQQYRPLVEQLHEYTKSHNAADTE